jgi:hypothetical protein
VPKPIKTSVTSIKLSFNDFTRRLRLSDAARRRNLIGGPTWSYSDVEKGQPTYVPKFHIPSLDAKTEKILQHMENALDLAGNLCIKIVGNRQCMTIRPNLNAREFTKLLKILEDERVIAVPSDKNLGLCLVTAEWYCDAAWKLLINPSYVEDEPDHLLLWSSLQTSQVRIIPDTAAI